jgi:tetratricopeptide (TPR) repeat protein/tRNA A-37 threonylcarbamoyl transferase component Bud32
MTQSSSARSASDWYRDESTVLHELRRIALARPQPPVIPGYDDLHEIHRGGQGIVYSAVQRSTRRRIAIKVLLDGALASDAARHRFQREIDLVASLRHPNIVRIYDSGVSQPPDPRVYFVMEHIEGVPLHEFVAPARALGHRAVLHLFARIGRAVSYAHQHGVIHRDLKPSNIRIDNEGEPHILDFGLAKIAQTEGSDALRSEVSVVGQFLGSLPWASPEQAQSDPVAIDVRSDVYSLGVILYQMLTSRFPYNVEGGLRDVLDRIVSSVPVRPSSVDRTIDDEVETIVLKCLAKEPERRYQSAAELAQDVERYLAGEPIQAKRDSAWYTMRKRLRRYRMLTAAAVLLALTLTAGISATLWQARLANQQRDSAQQRFDDVRQLARTVLFDLHDQIENLPGSRPARAALVATALEYLEKLAAEAGNDLDLLAELAAGYLRVGNLQGAPNAPNLGDTAGALASYQKAADLADRLAKHQQFGDEGWLLLIDVNNAIAEVHAARGSIERAVSYARNALGLAQQRMATMPHDPDATLRCAITHIKLGDVLGHPSFANAGRTLDAVAEYDQAEAMLAPVVDQQPDNFEVQRYIALLHERQGTMLEVRGRAPEALDRYTRSLALRAQLVKGQPDNANALRDLAIAHEKLGNANRALGNLDDAAEHYANASAVFDALAEVDPANVTAQRSSAINHERIGDLKLDMGDTAAAAESLQTSRNMFIELARRDPGNERAQTMAAIAHIKLGDVLGNPDFQNLGRPDDAIAQYEAALDMMAPLPDAAPDSHSTMRIFALLYERLGTMSLVNDEMSQALSYFQQSMELRTALADADSASTDIRRDVGIAHEKLGKVLERQQDYAAAAEQFSTALAIYASLSSSHPDTPQFARDVEVAEEHIARCTHAAAAPLD